MSFVVSTRQLGYIDEDGKRILAPGRVRLVVGGRQPDRRSRELTGSAVLEEELEITAARKEIPW